MVIRWVALLVFIGLPFQVASQTRSVDPEDLTLTVTLEELPATPMRQEMVLLTIHGIYKRHITLEKLEQPDLRGFNWMQLGEDHWFESMIDGRPVKNMRRRMALFPSETGTLQIGQFQHHLTLLDEDNKWFEYTVQSPPVTLDVAPAADTPGWWFPVRRLQVSDDWSNPPDQLTEGAGVLRIVRVSALGASPDMIPPMPELTSPSALIFAHPEKRLVDLTPYGPQAIAYWRWTITPTNGHAAIVEPISFSYFDTIERQMRTVDISPQRVAFGDVSGEAIASADTAPRQGNSHNFWIKSFVILGLCGGLFMSSMRQDFTLLPLKNWVARRQLLWAFKRAEQQGDTAALRQSAHALDRLYPASAGRTKLLSRLDSIVFGRTASDTAIAEFCRDFRRELRESSLVNGSSSAAVAIRDQ